MAEAKDMVFESKYGGGQIRAAQYICELICTKKAMMSNQTLTYKFWQEAEWGTVFKRWLRPVHKLLKSYPPFAIINALNDKKSGMKWSIHTEFMIKLIKEHAKKLKVEHKELKLDPYKMPAAKQSVPREPRSHGGILDNLDTEHIDINMGNE